MTAAGGPSEMQESERKYKWYYSPKCTFKNEKKAGREKTMVSVLTRAKKCAKISFVFEKDAGVAQSVEQLIRNQQFMCSSHTTSSKKHRKPRFSVLFCCKNAENGVGQNVGQPPDPHRDPHRQSAALPPTASSCPMGTTKCAERTKEHRRGNCFLSGALLACGTYRICAMKLPMVCAAFCCICRVAWV